LGKYITYITYFIYHNAYSIKETHHQPMRFVVLVFVGKQMLQQMNNLWLMAA
jgi:hypothetical protein